MDLPTAYTYMVSGMKSIHHIFGVLRNPQNRLLSRRETQGREFKGFQNRTHCSRHNPPSPTQFTVDLQTPTGRAAAACQHCGYLISPCRVREGVGAKFSLGAVLTAPTNCT